jgi:serine/threonine protein kinase
MTCSPRFFEIEIEIVGSLTVTERVIDCLEVVLGIDRAKHCCVNRSSAGGIPIMSGAEQVEVARLTALLARAQAEATHLRVQLHEALQNDVKIYKPSLQSYKLKGTSRTTFVPPVDLFPNVHSGTSTSAESDTSSSAAASEDDDESYEEESEVEEVEIDSDEDDEETVDSVTSVGLVEQIYDVASDVDDADDESDDIQSVDGEGDAIDQKTNADGEGGAVKQKTSAYGNESLSAGGKTDTKQQTDKGKNNAEDNVQLAVNDMIASIVHKAVEESACTLAAQSIALLSTEEGTLQATGKPGVRKDDQLQQSKLDAKSKVPPADEDKASQSKKSSRRKPKSRSLNSPSCPYCHRTFRSQRQLMRARRASKGSSRVSRMKPFSSTSVCQSRHDFALGAGSPPMSPLSPLLIESIARESAEADFGPAALRAQNISDVEVLSELEEFEESLAQSVLGDSQSSGDDAMSLNDTHNSAVLASSSSSASESGSIEGASDTESDSDWEDKFPFEENIFHLGQYYTFLERLSTNDDAVVYKAIAKFEPNRGQTVAIKLCLGSTRKTPKEVRVLACVQGSQHVPRLVAWHALKPTRCYAMTTTLVADDDIADFVWGSMYRLRIYLQDLLVTLRHFHAMNVLYRDVKQSNVLWDEKNLRANVIDYDVATFFNPDKLHRNHVGTHGFMALEMEEIYKARKAKAPMPYKGYGLAVDVYSAGVVFACILYGIEEADLEEDQKHPLSATGLYKTTQQLSPKFYDNLKDVHSLMVEKPSLPLRLKGKELQMEQQALYEAHKLMVEMMHPPEKRISIEDALQHNFFKIPLRLRNAEAKAVDERDAPARHQPPVVGETVAMQEQQNRSLAQRLLDTATSAVHSVMQAASGRNDTITIVTDSSEDAEISYEEVVSDLDDSVVIEELSSANSELSDIDADEVLASNAYTVDAKVDAADAEDAAATCGGEASLATETDQEVVDDSKSTEDEGAERSAETHAREATAVSNKQSVVQDAPVEHVIIDNASSDEEEKQKTNS